MYATFSLPTHLSCYISQSPSSGVLHTSLSLFIWFGLHYKPARGTFSVLASLEDTKIESPGRASPLIDYQDIALKKGNFSNRNFGANCLNTKHIR